MATQAMVNAAMANLVERRGPNIVSYPERVGHAIDAAIRHMPEKTAAAITDKGRALLEVARLRAALEEIAGLSMSHFYKPADMANGARHLAINALRDELGSGAAYHLARAAVKP